MKASELRDAIDAFLESYEDSDVFIEVNGLVYRAVEAFDDHATPENPSSNGLAFIVKG